MADIHYAGEGTLDTLSKLVKQAIAEAVSPDPDQPIEFGTDKHDELKNRDLPDQHPISSITGLTEALTGIETNAHAINTLREQNNIEHNTIRSAIKQAVDDSTLAITIAAQSAETVRVLNDAVDAVEDRQDGIDETVNIFDERLGDYKLQFNTAVRDLTAADEAQNTLIQENADAIKALQESGSSGLALGSFYLGDWSNDESPPTVGVKKSASPSSFVGKFPDETVNLYAVIVYKTDVYLCKTTHTMSAGWHYLEPTSVIKMGESNAPITTDSNPTFVGWATTYVNGTSEAFYVPYDKVSHRPDTGDMGLVIATDVNGDGTWMVYGSCAGDAGDDTFAMQMHAEARLDQEPVVVPKFGNLILNMTFNDPPITGRTYSIDDKALNRFPRKDERVAGIIRHGNDAFYVEGIVGAPESEAGSPIASFDKIVKLTANRLSFYDLFPGPPTTERVYGISEENFSRRPITGEYARGFIECDGVFYSCGGTVTYNPNVASQYNPTPNITFTYVKKISAPETIAWDNVTGKPDFSSVYRYKGSVATVDALPDTAEIGDVYNVVATGMNFGWTGEEWDALGGTVDLTEVNAAIEQLQTDVTNLNSSSTSQQEAINSLVENVGVLSSDNTVQQTSIDNHETRLASAEGSITTLETDVAQNESDIDVLVAHVTELIQRVPTKIVTKAEYDALTNAEKNSETLWLIKDATESGDGSSGGTSSPNNVYSTEEKRIGTWIDGEPLYRRTYVFDSVNTLLPSGTPNFQFGQIGDSSTIIHNVYGVVRSSFGLLLGTLPWTALNFNGKWGIIPYHRGSIDVIGIVTVSDSDVRDYTVSVTATVEYTKTTDVAEQEG